MENERVDLNELAVKIGSVIGVLGATNFTIGDIPIRTIPALLATSAMSYALPVGIGVIGLGGLYGCYRVLTKDKRELIEKRKEFCEFFIGAGLMNKQNEVPMLTNIYEGEYETVYSFIRPKGFSTHHFETKDTTIKEYFERDSIEFESNGDFINIKVTTVDLPRFIPFQLKERKNKDEVIVTLGRNAKGEDVNLNLSKCPNVMCSGMTGSGKSVNTNVIATQLYCMYPNVQIYLIDMKCVELGIYADMPQTKKYTNKLDGAKEIIKELLAECDRRNEEFNRLKVKKLVDYNKKVKAEDRIEPIVLIIDEAVRLMGDKDLNKDIAELGFICRSCEISIILNIQRPTSRLLNPDVKASLTNVIGFRTINRRNSEIICDENVLASLRGKGHGMLFNEDNDGVEFQGFYLGEDEIEKYLNKYCKMEQF